MNKINYLQVGTISSSTSLVHKDHSSWMAVSGWTACALLIVSGGASDKPTYFIFPSSTNFFNSPIYHTQTNVYTHVTRLIKYIHMFFFFFFSTELKSALSNSILSLTILCGWTLLDFTFKFFNIAYTRIVIAFNLITSRWNW